LHETLPQRTHEKMISRSTDAGIWGLSVLNFGAAKVSSH